MSGQPVTVNSLFDVVAFDSAGEAQILVSNAVPLHGAVACARGFNSGSGRHVAVVVPSGSVELAVRAKAPEPDGCVQVAPSPYELTERNFCRSPGRETAVRKTLLGWVSHAFGECDRAYFVVYDSVMEHLMAVGVPLPAHGGDDDGLASLELRLSRSETLAVWRAAMEKLCGQTSQ